VFACTFSIVGRASNGQLGIAVSSRVIGVGAHCAFVRPRSVAISSQAYSNPFLAFEMMDSVQVGASVRDAGRDALERDEAREWRQLIAIGATGEPFAHTGSETDPWTGHMLGDDCVAAGNLLVSSETVTRMVEAFEANISPELPERLLAALEVGEAAGGDRRGRQSAGLLVRANTEVAYVDLRVDEHHDPVAELRRLLSSVSQEHLDRALRTATSGELRSISELKTLQAQVRRALADEEQQQS
jgi:uncharacterized Ntn-hydrolase superfamily protein